MGLRWRCGVLLVLPLYTGRVQSLAMRACISRTHQPHGTAAWSSLHETAATRTVVPAGNCNKRKLSTTPRRQYQLVMSLSPRQDNNSNSKNGNTSWFSARALLSSWLAATMVVTGAVPGLELESLPTVRSNLWAAPSIVTLSSGVPTASAASFNDDQRAIAETWVRSRYLAV